MTALPNSIDETLALLTKGDYVADRALATVVFLSMKMGRPLFLEGEAGVGKTEIAKVLSNVLGRRLIRLQCYEGLDRNAALYEWNYQRQLLAIKAREGADADVVEDLIFSEKYLLERPLLAAIRQPKPPVLLINPVRRADFQRHAGIVRCSASAVSVSLCRFSGC